MENMLVIERYTCLDIERYIVLSLVRWRIVVGIVVFIIIGNAACANIDCADVWRARKRIFLWRFDLSHFPKSWL